VKISFLLPGLVIEAGIGLLKDAGLNVAHIHNLETVSNNFEEYE
jgi:hypothetical protein